MTISQAPPSGDPPRDSRHPKSRGSVRAHSRSHVLVISSDAAHRRMIARALIDAYEVLTAEDEAVALPLLANAPVEVVVVDEGSHDTRLLAELDATKPVDVVWLTREAGSPKLHDRVFYAVPRAQVTAEQVAWVVDRAVERRRMRERIQRLERKLEHQDRAGEIVGSSRVMQDVFDLAHGAAPASAPVLIVGESGTGKEMLARAMHRLSRRAANAFVSVDCGAIPPTRLHEELFGGVSSFAGHPLADTAHGGTLFLADVSLLPLVSQAAVVSLLQRGSIGPVDEPSRKIDARLIATTQQELKPLVDRNEFRKDLYFHLNAIVVRVPPLRRRKDDIPLLAYHFLHRHAQRFGRAVARISPEALRKLRDHRWAGNVRELEHAIERAVVLARTDAVLPGDLAFLDEEPQFVDPLVADQAPRDTAFDPSLFDVPYPDAKKRAVAAFDEAYVRMMLARAGGNVSEAARQAGLDRSNFRRLAKKAGREED